MELSRRAIFGAVVMGSAFGSAIPVQSRGAAAGGGKNRIMPAQTDWQPPLAEVAATEGLADIGSARLYYRDTGGKGPPIVLLHPATGSAQSWAFQEQGLARTGFRVISFSRRGHYRSEGETAPPPGSAAIYDLEKFVDHLGLMRFHLVGVAAGGFEVASYALTHPDRLMSASILSSLGGISEPEFAEVSRRMMSPEFMTLPEYMRELGPSFRAAFPDGVKMWIDIEENGRIKTMRMLPPPIGGGNGSRPMPAGVPAKLTWAEMQRIRVPLLLGTGDCDLFMPPSRLRQVASHVPDAETVIFSESGHVPFWEQPLAFNAMMTDFCKRSSK